MSLKSFRLEESKKRGPKLLTSEFFPILPSGVEEDASLELPLGEEVGAFRRKVEKNRSNSDPLSLLTGFQEVFHENQKTQKAMEDLSNFQEASKGGKMDDFEEVSGAGLGDEGVETRLEEGAGAGIGERGFKVGKFTGFTSHDTFWWDLELKTWKLLEALLIARSDFTADPLSVEAKNNLSDAAVLNHAIKSNPQLREELAVKNWLEKTADVVWVGAKRTGYFENTKLEIVLDKSLGFSRTSEILSELDPDAPFRQRKRLHPLDEEFERDFLKNVYEYIRKGELNEAIEFCRSNDQPWRAASIWGTFLWKYPLIDGDQEIGEPYGNQNRKLWKTTCKSLIEATNNVWEKAIYGALSGNIQPLLEVSRCWEDHLWAYYTALIEQRQEEELSRQDVMDVDLNKLNVEKIFQQIDNSALKFEEELREPAKAFRFIQKCLILDREHELINFTRDLYHNGKNLHRKYLRDHFQLSRFLAHLGLYFKRLQSSNSAHWDEVIEEYIKNLLRCKMTTEIPIYIAELSPDKQATALCEVLLNVTDPDLPPQNKAGLTEKEKLVKEFKRFNIDLIGGLRLMVQQTCWLLKFENQRLIVNDRIQLMQMVVWLVITGRINMFVSEVLTLAWWFLSEKKISLAKEILDTVENSNIDWNSQTIDVREKYHSQQLLLTVLTNLEVDPTALFSNQPELERLEANYISILSNASFLSDYSLAHKWVPVIVFSLHGFYFRSSEKILGNLRKSLDVSVLVADESFKLYEFFSEGDLKILLELCRKSQIELMKRDALKK